MRGITTELMREVDRIMVEDLDIPVELMMEHAGLNLAKICVKEFPTSSFLVIVGSGNNGGGGLVASRRLAAWGLDVTVVIPRGRKRLHEVPSRQLKRIEGSAIINVVEDITKVEVTDKVVCIDAFIGYGFRGLPDEYTSQVFQFIRSFENIVSLDTPSGVNTTTGEDLSGIRPVITATIAFVKSGHLKIHNDVGRIFVIDIGVPIHTFADILQLNGKEFESLRSLYHKFTRESFVEVGVGAEGWFVR